MTGYTVIVVWQYECSMIRNTVVAAGQCEGIVVIYKMQLWLH